MEANGGQWKQMEVSGSYTQVELRGVVQEGGKGGG